MTDNPKGNRRAVVGNIGFWLLVPPTTAVIAGWGAHALYNPLNMWAIAALVYALFTLWMISRNQKWYVRGPLALANLALISASGYFEWQHLRPVAWPTWTDYLGAGIAALLWFVVAYFVFNGMGQSEQEDHQSNHNSNPSASVGGGLSTEVEERIMAFVKLAGHKGDFTVNLRQFLDQLGLEAETRDRDSRNQMADGLLRRIKAGVYTGAKASAAYKLIEALDKLPELGDEGSDDDDGDWDEGADEVRPSYGQFT